MLSVAHKKKCESADLEYFKAYRESYLCALFFNVYRDRTEHPDPISTYDFMPEYPKPKPPERIVMTDEQIEATINNFVYPMLKAAEENGRGE